MKLLLKLSLLVGVYSLCGGLPLTAAQAGEASGAKVAEAKQAEANEVKNREADNTGRNKRDRDGKSLTADDQGNGGGDVEAVAKIRRAIVDDDGLSINAHNVKIIVDKSSVTLRGVVDSKAEKTRVEKLVKQSADGKRVVNKLEVSP